MSRRNVAGTFLLICSLFIAVADSAESDVREQWIEKIEAQYVSPLPPDSPALIAMVEEAKRANPAASPDVWPTVQTELASAFHELLFGKGTAMEKIVRRALQPMSTEELQHLSAVLGDPSYMQFRAAISTTTAEQELKSGALSAGMQLGPALNSILEQHQLNKVP